MKPNTGVLETATEWLDNALLRVDGDAILTSPYMSYEVCSRIAAAATNSPESWQLVTTLDPSAVANGYLNVQGLMLLLEAGVDVRHVNQLHAKCFVIGSRAMLGSANLTGAGLGSTVRPNRELGIELSSAHASDALAAIASWPAMTVGRRDLDQLYKESRELTRPDEHTSRLPLTTASALFLAERLLADARDPGRTLWLKLEYGEPKLAGWTQESWFASPKKGKPSFDSGDLVFICAKSTRDCYAVVEVVSDPEFQPQDYIESKANDPEQVSRWPWVSRTIPRFVPAHLTGLTHKELGVGGQSLRNGHVKLPFDQFTAGVRALARMTSG